MVAWLAPVLGGIASSVAGSILGSGDQRTQESIDLQKLVRDAQAAGFNPLTALQATGGRGWGSTVSSNDLDFGDMAAAAIMQGFGDYWTQKQTRDLQTSQKALVDAQTQSLRADMSARSNPGKVGPVGGGYQDMTPNPFKPQNDNPFTAHERDTTAPIVDVNNVRPELARVPSGKYAGRYVVSALGKHYVLPKNTPTATLEELQGGLISEGDAVLNYLRENATRVYVDDRHQKGLVYHSRPKPSERQLQTLFEGYEDAAKDQTGYVPRWSAP